jgi:hypothetical protein
MRSAMCFAVAAPGAYYRMNFLVGSRSIAISAAGKGMERGRAPTMRCADICVSTLAERLSQVPPSWTVNRSKPAPSVAIGAASTEQKKIRGRKRHLLVETQGLLLAVKVLAADLTDREGARTLLTPLVGKMPRLQLIWADSGY